MPILPTEEDKEKAKKVYENYATPLSGTFLNLTREPALIDCPSCGIKDTSDVKVELRPMTNTLNFLYCCVFVCLCCRCCFDFSYASKKSDANHYCKHCRCYLGRAKRVQPVQYEKGVKITNMYDCEELY